MNPQKNIILFTLFVSIFLTCSKKKNSDEIRKFQSNTNISDEEALYGISKIIFGDTLKSFKSEKNQNNKQDVVIEYGGNRAYTFSSEANYSEKIQMETVRYILLFFQSGQSRNLDNLRISLVKPYFVKEPTIKKEMTEEFEVFRVNISYSEISKVPDWQNSELVNENRSNHNSKVIEFFNQVRLRWKIELNELNRIELK